MKEVFLNIQRAMDETLDLRERESRSLNFITKASANKILMFLEEALIELERRVHVKKD